MSDSENEGEVTIADDVGSSTIAANDGSDMEDWRIPKQKGEVYTHFYVYFQHNRATTTCNNCSDPRSI